MALYELLAPVYDVLFPVNPATLDCLDRLGPPRERGRRALDIGSATGGHALALARRGWTVIGLEPSPEMLRQAQAAAARLGREEPELELPRFILGAMPGSAAELDPGSFDLLLCLGNTLPHLGSRDELGRFLGAAAGLLKAEGRLVLQLLNYARPGLGPGFAFPELEAGGFRLRRRYEELSPKPGPGVEAGQGRYRSLRFVVELEDPAGDRQSDELLLSPLEPAELVTALRSVGFASLELWADWQGRPFSVLDDPYLILVAGA